MLAFFIDNTCFSCHNMNMITKPLPEPQALYAGYSALINSYELRVPEPLILSAISKKHRKYETDDWQIFTPRHAPADTLYGHLSFALRYEGIDLAVFNALFEKIDPGIIEDIIRIAPNGKNTRRIWLLFEYLTGKILSVPDITRRSYIDLVDSNLQYPGPARPSKRHLVNNNLSGVRDFCPLVRRTTLLDQFIEQDLSHQAHDIIKDIHTDSLAISAAYLLLEESKSSFAIEGETPLLSKAEHWGQVIGLAGTKPLSKEEFEQLQIDVLGDSRFINMGYRCEGGFIGKHDRSTQMPIPSHISAKHQDLEKLINGLIETAALLSNSDYPPVLAATIIAFGFVFIHPFEDGNGRLHRYLFHHVLSKTGFTPEGIIFPVSSVILRQIKDYRAVLEAYSKPRLSLVNWQKTAKGNVDVLNETLDLYRFFDATQQAEFFYNCVSQTITKTLSDEVSYLQKFDLMKAFVNNKLDMPDYRASLMVSFLHQNNGRFSKRARKKEFSALTDNEIGMFEAEFKQIFAS